MSSINSPSPDSSPIGNPSSGGSPAPQNPDPSLGLTGSFAKRLFSTNDLDRSASSLSPSIGNIASAAAADARKSPVLSVAELRQLDENEQLGSLTPDQLGLTQDEFNNLNPADLEINVNDFKALSPQQRITEIVRQMLKHVQDFEEVASTTAATTAAAASDQQSELIETAAAVTKAVTTVFSCLSELSTHLGNHIASGGFGAVYDFKASVIEDEDRGLVIKVAHPRGHYLVRTDTIEEIRESIAKAERDIQNEAEILLFFEEGGPYDGIQLPPHSVFNLGGEDDLEARVGYIGARYDGSLADDLQARFNDRKFCTPQLALQLLDGLEFLHLNEFIHGDIKEANILVREGPPPRVDLADFGGARSKENAKKQWDEVQEKLRDLTAQAEQKLEDLRSKPGGTASEQDEITSKLAEEKELLYSQIIGTHTPDDTDRTMNIMLLVEVELIEKGKFDEWYEAAQRRDVYALGCVLEKMFPWPPRALDPILDKMKSRESYSAEEAAGDWGRAL